MAFWESEDDFQNDWWSLAENPSLSRPTPPVTETLKRVRSLRPSIYDEEEEAPVKEDIEYTTRPSRGRNHNVKLKRPGDKETIESQIREVSDLP